jgi:hypothetical protein
MRAKEAATMLGGSLAISVVMAVLFGCGGAASLILKSPIAEKCRDAGLRGCDDLADGVIEYATGDRGEAKAKLKKGAAANAPDQLQEFAAKLRMLKSIPGAAEYMGPILEVADLLAGKPAANGLVASAEGSPTHEGVALREGGTAPREQVRHEGSAAQTAVAIELRAGSVVPAAEPDRRKCGLLLDANLDEEAGVATCVTVATGPLVVTDIQTSGGCPDTLVVGAGTSVGPTWFLLALPGALFGVHGASYPVRPGQGLFAAQMAGADARALRASGAAAGARPIADPFVQSVRQANVAAAATASETARLRRDSRCAITWAIRVDPHAPHSDAVPDEGQQPPPEPR